MAARQWVDDSASNQYVIQGWRGWKPERTGSWKSRMKVRVVNRILKVAGI